MTKKNIEDRFSRDIDTYLKNKTKENQLETEEYNEYLEIGKNLADMDFSLDSNKDKVLERISKNINESKGESIMKKVSKHKVLSTIAASAIAICVISVPLSQTAMGQDLIGKALRTISLGHITATEYEESNEDTVSVPKKLKGKIFDKDGKLIEVISSEYNGEFYTASGEEIYDVNKDGEVVTVAEYEKEKNDTTLTIKDFKELNKYTCFNVILPSYLPEGYEFDRAEFYKDEEGNVENSKYIDIFFKYKDKEIFMQQRFADEETGYEMGMDKDTEKVKINGVDAIVSKGNIDWEDNGVLYGISGRKAGITKNEIIKIAESIK